MQHDDCKAYTDKQIKELEEDIKAAFIGGDFARHRSSHEESESSETSRKLLWQGVKEKTLSGVIWAAILFLGTAAWDYIVKLLAHLK